MHQQQLQAQPAQSVQTRSEPGQQWRLLGQPQPQYPALSFDVSMLRQQQAQRVPFELLQSQQQQAQHAAQLPQLHPQPTQPTITTQQSTPQMQQPHQLPAHGVESQQADSFTEPQDSPSNNSHEAAITDEQLLDIRQRSGQRGRSRPPSRHPDRLKLSKSLSYYKRLSTSLAVTGREQQRIIDSLKAKRQKSWDKATKRKARIKSLVATNKAMKAEVATLRLAQKAPAYNPQRIGKGKRAWLTSHAKMLTLECMREGGMACERWSPLLLAVGANLSSTDEPLDLRPCHDRTVRRLLAMDDMVWLLKEIEYLSDVKDAHGLQLMCDISPLLHRKHPDFTPASWRCCCC
jgi:hypothetical protein